MSTALRACRNPDLLSTLGSRLADADFDSAIEAGLMDFVPCGEHCCAQADAVHAAQQRLQQAWAARDRHRARAMRLHLRAVERNARRTAAASGAQRPSLPPAAAAILARAKAKAAKRSGGHEPA